MKSILGIAVVTIVCGAVAVWAQNPASAQSPSTPKPADESARADVYYYFTMGHVLEQQFEVTGRSELATQSIESYKKALELDPGSGTLMARLAEIYAKSQHIDNAIAEAQEALKADPDNLEAHRLLARIYVRTLGDLNSGDVQNATLSKAIDQLQAILRIEPGDSNSAVLLARLYRFENEHDKAEVVLRKILKQDPENGQALELLSQLLIDEARPQEAIDLLTKAAGDSSSPDIYELLGDAYSQSKDYPKAENAYRKAIEGDPDDVGHIHGLAQVLLAEERYAEALKQYQKLAELEPSTADNYIRMAQLYRRSREFDKAESSLLRAKQLAPGDLEVLYNEALLYEDQGRYDDAGKVLSDAIAGVRGQSASDRNPNALAILYEQLGRVYCEQENYVAAIHTYEDMAKLGPDAQKRAQMLLIEAYRESREIDRAIAETKKALVETPKDSSLIEQLAALYGEKTEAAVATKLLEGLLQGNERDQEIYLDIAQVQERGRDYAAAEQSAEKADQMAHDPTDKQTAWFLLGAIYERQKKFDQAEQQFRKVLEASPNKAAVLNYYGYMLADRGIRLEEATSMIRRAVEQEPNNGAYLDSLGWAYYKQNKLAEAEEYLRKAVDRQSHDPTILSHLGDVYMKLGQSERAAEIWQHALAEWQRALPADYEADKVSELEAQLKNLKRRLAQKSSTETAKPQ